MEHEASIAQLLVNWSKGDRALLEHLTPHVYQELQVLARSYLRRGRPNQTLQPTALVNEVWLRLIGQTHLPRWEGRAHFIGIAARLMRLVLVDYACAHSAAKREGAEAITLQETIALTPARVPAVLEVNEALDHLARVDERKAKVIELRYFGGMEREEIAATLGVTLPTVKRDLCLGRCGCGGFGLPGAWHER